MNRTLQYLLKFTGDTGAARRQIEQLDKSVETLGQELKQVGQANGLGTVTAQLQALAQKASGVGGATAQEFKKIEAGAKSLASAVQQAGSGAGAVGSNAGVKELANKFNEASAAASALKGVIGSVAGVLGAGIGAGAVIAFAKSVFDAGLASEKLGNQLKFVSGSAAGAARELTYIREAANRIGLDFSSAAGAYAKFAAAAKGSALEGAASREIFEALGKASTVMGLSAEETNGALLAVSQMMSKGTVSAEELRGQLGERLPGAFGIAARAMGVTTSKLGDMLEKGEILASDFLPRFARELTNSLGDAPQSAAHSAQAQLNRLNSEWDLFKQSLANSGFLEVTANGLRILAGGINSVNTAIDAKMARGLAELERLKTLQAGELAMGESDQAEKTGQMIVDTRRRIAALQAETKAATEAAEARKKANTPADSSYDAKEAGRARAVLPTDNSAAIEALKKFTDQYRTEGQKAAEAIKEYKLKVLQAGKTEDPKIIAEIQKKFGKDAEQMRSAFFAIVKATAEADMKLMQQQLSAAGEAYQRAYDQRLIGVRDFYAAQAAIQDQALAAQEQSTRLELSRARANAGNARGEEEAAKRKVDVIRLEGELAVVTAKRGQVSIDANNKTIDGLRTLKEELEAVRLKLAETMGNATPEQTADAVRARYKNLLEQARGNAADVPGGADLVEKMIDVETAKERLQQIQSAWARTIGDLNAEEQRINILRENGLLGEIDARSQIFQLQRDAATALQAQIPMLDELADKYPHLATQIAGMRNEWLRLSTVTDEWTATFNGAAKSAVAGFFQDATSRSKTFGQAAMDALNAIRNKMVNMAAERLADEIFKTSGSGSSGGNFLGGIASLIGGWFGGDSSSGAGNAVGIDVSSGGTYYAHTGAVIGHAGGWLRSGMNFSAEQIAAAPRFHTGGLIGRDERLLVGKVGEEVLTADDPRHVNNRAGQAPQIHIHEAAGARVSEVKSNSNNGRSSIEIFLEQADGYLARNLIKGQGSLTNALETVGAISRGRSTRGG